MEAVSAWVKDIFIIILSITFMEILMPDSSMAKYIKFIFSIIILAAILSPIEQFLS